jgi:2-polyprenyl-3-methyl-5-hydroxy-6-metoxy-1,4-benzoquinol methylase
VSNLPRSTTGPAYTRRQLSEERAFWKRFLVDRQAPYRYNLRRLEPGFTLDVGCGIGRNLENLGGLGVGVDHNVESVAVARSRGYEAFTLDEFAWSPYAVPGRFDSMLVAHVLEHLTREKAVDLVRAWLPYVAPGGKVIVITPQQQGHRADPTHKTFMDFEAVRSVLDEVGVETRRQYSFPFARWVGHFFRYNEFVTVGAKSAG